MPAEHYHSGSNPDLGFIIMPDLLLNSSEDLPAIRTIICPLGKTAIAPLFWMEYCINPFNKILGIF